MTYVIIDGKGLQGLGAAPAVTDPAARKQIIELGIVALTKANDAAKKAADRVVSKSTLSAMVWIPSLLAQGSIREWRQTFVAQVEAMVVRCLTVGHDGVFPFERNPKLITDIAQYIEQESKSIAGATEEMLSLTGALRQAAAAVVAQSVAALSEAVKATIKAAKEADSMIPILVGVGVLGLGAAYVWRSFR